MKYTNKEECIAASLDEAAVNAIAKRLSDAGRDARKLGLTIFGGSGHGTLRINDNPNDKYSRTLIVAQIEGGSWDGGDGAYGTRGEDGLMRGE